MPLLMAAAMQPATALASENTAARSGSQPGTMSRPANMPYSPMIREHMRDFRRLMHNPFNRSVFDIYVLPTMQKKLDLSSSQVTQLQQMKDQYLKQEHDHWKQIADKESSLRKLFEAGSPKTDQVKSVVMNIANLRAEQQLASYDTAVHMRGVLNQEQLTKLHALKTNELGNYAMNHLTLMDAAQMARLMRSSMAGWYGMTPQRPQQSAMMMHHRGTANQQGRSR
jgi:hypothetical protein